MAARTAWAARLLLGGLLLLACWGCAGQRPVPHEPGGQPRGGAEAAPGLYRVGPNGLEPKAYADFPEYARGVDYILLGEGHTIACDHRAQAALLQALIKAGRRPALALEMVGADLQPVLDKYNADHSLAAAEFARRLEQELDWSKRWGHPYQLYAPIFRLAYAAGLPFYGVNAPPQVVRTYRRTGVSGLSAQERAFLPERIILPGEAQKKALANEFAQHSAMLAKMRKKANKRLPRLRKDPIAHFFKIQSLWDTAMAAGLAAVKRDTGRQVVLLAGSGHVENGWGVARRLRLLDPGARILLVAPWRGGPFPRPEFADLVFHCARAQATRATHAGRYGFTLEWRTNPKGALITDVRARSTAEEAGFQKNDLIVAVLGRPLRGMTDLHTAAMRARESDAPLLFTVLRGQRRLTLELPIWRIKLKDSKD